MSDPQELLNQLGQEGQLDSSGQFTVDPVKARDKLRRFQFAHPGLWLLKLIQAGVALGAGRIDLHLGGEVRVDFPLPDTAPLQSLGDLLRDPTRPALPGVRDMVVGLLSLEQQGRPWRLEVTAAAQSELPGFVLEGSPRGTQELPLLKGAPQAGCHLNVKPGGSLVRRLVSKPISERHSLNWRCGLCPVPLFVDGKPVALSPGGLPFEEASEVDPELQALRKSLRRPSTPGLPEPPRLLTGCWPGRAFSMPLLPARALSPTLPGEPQPNRAAQISFLYCPEPVAEQVVGGRLACRACLVVPRQNVGLSLLQPVRHGVCLDPEVIPWESGAEGSRVILDASDLSTDLSDFRLVKNEAYEARLAKLRELLLETCEASRQAFQEDAYFRNYVLKRLPKRA